MSANLFGTPTPIAEHSTTVYILKIYDWNSDCITPLTRYGIIAGTEWRLKLSIPLSHVRRFIRDSHPHSTTAHILKYTIEIVYAAHRLQAMTSDQRCNEVEN